MPVGRSSSHSAARAAANLNHWKCSDRQGPCWVGKGSRPLKFEEACAIADALEIDVASLSRVIDNDNAAAAAAQIQRSNIIIARTERQIEEGRERARESEKLNRAFIERVTAVK